MRRERSLTARPGGVGTRCVPACGVADRRRQFRDVGARPPAAPNQQLLRTSKEQRGVIRRNAGASLVDLGDGVLCIEFHSKMNALGGDTIQMLQAGVAEASADFAALVVGNEAVNFSAGANLMLLLLEAQEGNWDEVDLMVRAFQGATMALRYADVPVVVAPGGLALGGGCEIALHGIASRRPRRLHRSRRSRRRADPGRRRNQRDARARDGGAPPAADPLPHVQTRVRDDRFREVSTSAADARRIGYSATRTA